MTGLKSLKTLLNKYIQLNKIIVDQSLAVVPAKRIRNHPVSELDIEEDFIYFCFSKLTKTTISIKKLIDYGLYEDALILTRSNYENLIFAKSVILNSGMINNFVEYKLGLINEKKYKYVDFKNGKIVNIQEPAKKIQLKDKIKDIAKAAKEQNTHKVLYSFLCDITHCNFVTSSYYRDGVSYSYLLKNQVALFNVLLWNIFINFKFYLALINAEIIEIEELEEMVIDRINIDLISLTKQFETEEKRITRFSKDNTFNEEELHDLSKYLDNLKTLKDSLTA